MRLVTSEDFLPVPFESHCRNLVPTAGKFIVSRQNPTILFTVLQQNPLLISL